MNGKILIITIIVVVISLLIGKNRRNHNEKKEVVNLLTKNVNFVAVVCTISIMIQATGKIVLIHWPMIAFAYAISLTLLGVSIIFAFKKGNYNKYTAFHNIVVMTSIIIYMYIGKITNNNSCFTIGVITILLIGLTIYINQSYMQKNKDAYTEDIKQFNMLTLGSASGILLGFFQLQWVFGKTSLGLLGVILDVCVIIYMYIFRWKYIKNEKKDISLLIIMGLIQLTINMFNFRNISVIIILILIIYLLIKLIQETNIDNYTTLIGAITIAGTISNMQYYMSIVGIILFGIGLYLSGKEDFLTGEK